MGAMFKSVTEMFSVNQHYDSNEQCKPQTVTATKSANLHTDSWQRTVQTYTKTVTNSANLY